MLCADHGPCVSGAHNAIVTSRAGKDLVSCLVSGLLTIGPRFGGAIDDAARCFKVRLTDPMVDCQGLCTPSMLRSRHPLQMCHMPSSGSSCSCCHVHVHLLRLITSYRTCTSWHVCTAHAQDAVERKLDPVQFVEGLKKRGKRVPGIGHRIKSKDNRDKRVELLQQYARKVRQPADTGQTWQRRSVAHGLGLLVQDYTIGGVHLQSTGLYAHAD